MPTSSETFALAAAQLQAGNLGAAEHACRQILAAEPQHIDAWHLLGVIAFQQGRWSEAVTAYRQALRLAPDFVEAHYHLGNALLNLNQWDEAAGSYRQALRLRPELAAAHSNLGVALWKQGKLDEAIASYQQAVRWDNDLVQTYANMGMLLLLQGKPDEAVASYRQVLRLQPANAQAHNNLGNALLEQGRLDEARASYEQAVKLLPDYALAHANLGILFLKQGKADEAAASYLQALQLKPDLVEAVSNLGDLRHDQGNLEEATAYYQKALRIRPQNRLRIRLATLLPPIYRSMSHLLECRQMLIDNIARLRQEGVTLDPRQELPPNAFYLAYQGFNDRDILRALAGLYTPPDEPLRPRPATTAKIKVGILSSFLFDHAVGRVVRGLVSHLTRADFSVYVLSLGTHQDHVARFIRQQADHYYSVPTNASAACRLIRQLGLDVLFYADIGMEPITYALGLFRLAPVQCVLGGHPETTGIPTIDYYLSSELMEAPHAQEHYTETLVRLKTLPVYYDRPPVPVCPRERKYFGLPEGHLYGCLQTLFKFHPEFDFLIGEILRRDPQGQLLLIHAKYPSWDRLLMERFRETIPDVVERIRFVPPQGRGDFLSLINRCDVMLDPLHFGGGTTSYECFAVGTPIVTLPPEFLRGRVTLGMYKKMGVMDGVATDARHYVELAVRLGTDPDLNARLRSKILAASGVLYEDVEAVRELETFFKMAVDLSFRET